MNFDWISQYESQKIFDPILNFILVLSGGQRATKVEWNNFTEEQRKVYEPLGIELIKRLGLYTFPDPHNNYRVFVVKDKDTKPPQSDDDIGVLLELMGNGHDGSNVDLRRIVVTISEMMTKSSIYVETCNSEKISRDVLTRETEKKVKRFNDAMERFGLKYRFDYSMRELTPRKDLLENFENREYVKKHLDDYVELLENEFYANTRFKRNPRLVLDRSDAFDLVMNMIRDGELATMYSSVEPSSKEYHALLRTLKILEAEMFQA